MRTRQQANVAVWAGGVPVSLGHPVRRCHWPRRPRTALVAPRVRLALAAVEVPEAPPPRERDEHPDRHRHDERVTHLAARSPLPARTPAPARELGPELLWQSWHRIRPRLPSIPRCVARVDSVAAAEAQGGLPFTSPPPLIARLLGPPLLRRLWGRPVAPVCRPSSPSLCHPDWLTHTSAPSCRPCVATPAQRCAQWRGPTGQPCCWAHGRLALWPPRETSTVLAPSLSRCWKATARVAAAGRVRREGEAAPTATPDQRVGRELTQGGWGSCKLPGL